MHADRQGSISTPTSITSNRRTQVVGAVFYGGLSILLLAILTTLLREVLPSGLAGRIGYNSEGYLLALILCAWIQFVLPRLGATSRWPVALTAGAACMAIGIGLYVTQLPSQIKTLNETFLALGLILPYVALVRPLRRWPLLASAVVLIVVVLGTVFGPETGLIVQLAEAMVMLFLVPLSFDVVDRGILEPRARTSSALRYSGYALLVVVPLVIVALGTAARSGEGAADVLEYVGRAHEAFIGVLLVLVYLAVLRGRAGAQERRSS